MKLRLEKLSQKYNKWLNSSKTEASKLSENDPKKRDKHLKHVAETRVELYQILSEAVSVKIQCMLSISLVQSTVMDTKLLSIKHSSEFQVRNRIKFC